MDRIPILKMGRFLLVTIQVDMYDELALTLQDDLTERIARERARGVLIDISSLDVVDSFIGRMLEKLGFVPTGLSAERYSCARGSEAVSKLYRLRLIERQEAMAA